MSLAVAKKLRYTAEKRKRKRPLIRAFFNKLLHPTRLLMVYTPANFANPYQTLLYSGFKKTLVTATTADKFMRYQAFGLTNLLHIHWDEDFLRKNDPSRASRVRASVQEFKRKEGKVVWTVHNEMPHEIADNEEKQHFLNNRAFLCNNADLIHVHSEYAKEYLLKTFDVNEDKIAVIPHPSYVEWYCAADNQQTFRTKKVFLLFGSIRKYKGFDLIIEAFSSLAYPERIDFFHIAGNGADSINVTDINGIKIQVTSGYIDDDDVPSFFDASDFAIFGFSSILTSGSLMLALTFGLPPIAPSHPSIKESLPSELHDLLYDPHNSLDFARVIDHATSLSPEAYAAKSRACKDFALANSPSKISLSLEKAILKLISK